MPIKRYPSWDPRGWPEAQMDPPTQPLGLPNQLARLRPAIDPLDVFAALTLPLDAPDPHGLTPLFDRAWALSGMSGRHARTPTGEVPVGQHHDDDRDGVINRNERRQIRKDDGTVYERIPAGDIEDCDHVDSTTVVDDGAPA